MASISLDLSGGCDCI